jgi:WS/DGAT/MGAT family acyltransferase
MGGTGQRKSLGALDRSFLAQERRDVMMHVGALLEFSPSNESSKDFSRDLREELATLARSVKVEKPWNLRLNHPDMLTNPLQAWIADEHFDLEYHVRRSALASPGDERELGSLVSRLHGTPLDFHRPPWEAHFIEGLEKKRFAIYFKVHHSLIDGYTGMRLLAKSLSTDPGDLDTPLFFARSESERRREHEEPAPTLSALLDAVRDQVGVAKDIGRAVFVTTDRSSRCLCRRPSRSSTRGSRAAGASPRSRSRSSVSSASPPPRAARSTTSCSRSAARRFDASSSSSVSSPSGRSWRWSPSTCAPRTTPAAATPSGRSSRRSRPTSRARGNASTR